MFRVENSVDRPLSNYDFVYFETKFNAKPFRAEVVAHVSFTTVTRVSVTECGRV